MRVLPEMINPVRGAEGCHAETQSDRGLLLDQELFTLRPHRLGGEFSFESINTERVQLLAALKLHFSTPIALGGGEI